MEFVWFWIALFLIVFAVFAWPTWPYTRERWPYRYGRGWSYVPALSAIAVFLLVFFLAWIGALAVAYPW